MVVYCIKFVLRGESPKEKTEPSIIMVALFLTNYLNDISCFTSFNLLIENSFLFISLPVLV